MHDMHDTWPLWSTFKTMYYCGKSARIDSNLDSKSVRYGMNDCQITKSSQTCCCFFLSETASHSVCCTSVFRCE